MVSVKQVHGTDALVVDQPVEHGATFEGGWDAVVTDQPGVMVTVRTADCVPVLLHDPVDGWSPQSMRGVAWGGRRYCAEDGGAARGSRGHRRRIENGDRALGRSLLLRSR